MYFGEKLRIWASTAKFLIRFLVLRVPYELQGAMTFSIFTTFVPAKISKLDKFFKPFQSLDITQVPSERIWDR